MYRIVLNALVSQALRMQNKQTHLFLREFRQNRSHQYTQLRACLIQISHSIIKLMSCSDQLDM